jgi:hypothetical protein
MAATIRTTEQARVLAQANAPHDYGVAAATLGAEVGEIDPFTNRLSAPLEAALEPVAELIARECMNQV